MEEILMEIKDMLVSRNKLPTAALGNIQVLIVRACTFFR
jgi:hypothetical protein